MPKLVFFLGPAGAGKTTLAKAVAKRRRAPFFDMDTLLRPAAEAIMTMSGLDPNDRDSAVYKSRCRDLGYRITMDAALENLELGSDALVVGPFTRETEDPGWLQQELARIGEAARDVEVKVIQVRLADEELYRQRIAQRGSALDLWKLDNWETFKLSLADREIRWANFAAAAKLDFDNSVELTESRLQMVERFIDAPLGNSHASDEPADPLRYPIGRFEPAGHPNAVSDQRDKYIAEIAQLAGKLRLAVQNLTLEQLHTPYRPGGWTIQQVVHHMADNDMNAFIRFKRALTEDNPAAGSYKENLWAKLGDYDTPLESSLTLLESLHSRFADLLRSLQPDDFGKTFVSPTHGLMTLDVAAQRYAWHSRHHMAQIVSLIERSGWK